MSKHRVDVTSFIDRQGRYWWAEASKAKTLTDRKVADVNCGSHGPFNTLEEALANAEATLLPDDAYGAEWSEPWDADLGSLQ
jgi:hypothetical protein